MHHSASIDRVRCYVRETFQDIEGCDATSIVETVLIRDGFYCGRRFDCCGWQAVWFLEEDQIKFYEPQGGVAKVCAASRCHRQAA